MKNFENAIELRSVTKSYGEFKLSNIDLTLPKGCIMGLVGENGAGKSTTIKLILDMIRRDSGEILLFGQDNRENTKLLKEDIGVVLDEVGLPSCLNAREIGKIMKLSFKNWDEAAYEKYLRELNLPDRKRFKDFSKGMKMKLGIAVALSHKAKLLILDEATSGIDPVMRDELSELFSEFTRDPEHSVLISSHIVSDLEKICDYIAFLHKGKLLLCEEKDLLREEYRIVRGTAGQISAIDSSKVIGVKQNPYAAEAIVHRDAVPAGLDCGQADIEQLFIFMVKDGRK